uniref:Uncharacterized protein n=1 Tax=Anguilla anguilla TaxID=7936 RepID=A0A0E9WE18_ANGAN
MLAHFFTNLTWITYSQLLAVLMLFADAVYWTECGCSISRI